MVWLLKWALNSNRILSPFVLGVGTLFQFVWMTALAVGVILGIWDGLVWLFKADWRTTEFQGVFWAAVVGVPSLILSGVFGVLAEKLDEWRASLEGEIEVEKQLAASRQSKSKP